MIHYHQTHTQANTVNYGVRFKNWLLEVFVHHFVRMELEFIQILTMKLSVTCGENYNTSRELVQEHQYHKEVEVVVNVCLPMGNPILIFGAK